MTNRQIVSALREMGHKVEVYIRKDGSLRVTSLDGQKFSHRLSEGVQAARNLYLSSVDSYGPPVEAKRYEDVKRQRALARFSRKQGNTLSSQDKAFQQAFRRMQAKVRRINKKLIKEGKSPKFGLTWYSTKTTAKAGGISLEEQLRRSQDYFEAVSAFVAPPEMVKRLLDRLYEYVDIKPELQQFIDVAEANRKSLDIYETKKTFSWLYGYVKDVTQSETFEERLAAFRNSVHVKA